MPITFYNESANDEHGIILSIAEIQAAEIYVYALKNDISFHNVF